MKNRQKQFEAKLKEFPKPVRDILQTIPQQAGRLFFPQCTELMKYLEIDPPELMIRLLPLAKMYAVVPVSRFQVGAVAMAGKQGAKDHVEPFDLFLGANMEFKHQALNQTIHAEQSATLNAWHQGARYLEAVATSEAPCGHCRQFLYEFEKNAEIMVITPDLQNRTYRQTALSDLLPEAFGPLDLGNRTGLMSSAPKDHKLQLSTTIQDQVVDEALSAAEKSYAPYTQNFAGCALETQTGEIYGGRYVESVAYNPSMPPLQSAILCMNMASPEHRQSIQRVVLVEKSSLVSLRKATELFLASWAPDIEMGYYVIN